MLRSGRVRDCLAILAGLAVTFSLAPFDAWPLAFVGPAMLYLAVESGTTGRALTRFYLFNVAMFGSGVSWIYVSIHVYGGASVVLAGLLVVLFVLAYSLICLPLAWVYARYLRAAVMASVLGFAGLWVLQEWLRSWFLTGFPWLFSGYGLMESPLAGLAPFTGVFGLSLVACLVGVSVLACVRARRWPWLVLPAGVLLLSLAAGFKDMTRLDRAITVSLLQGNVDQHLKWLPSSRMPILNHYRSATSDELGRDLIVWPEAALTVFRQSAATVLRDLDAQAAEAGSTLVFGIPDRNAAGGFQNTVVALGQGEGQYIKRRLVPFGEYVPLEGLIRGVIQFFDLPMSRNRPGPSVQAPLTAGALSLSTSICYEVVYPDLVRETVADPDLLVTVSNDTWFGESIGPWQHLQMARMRALENGRAMARATNNGITALIDHRGRIVSTLPRFRQGTLRGELEVRSGHTPFHRFGSYPVLALSCLFIGLAFLLLKKRA
ncbi:MAG: apolipoprotein N-acyltransferase [Gammaproteobacteria bacterium]